MEKREIPTLDIGQYDPVTDSVVIEGTRYSGHLFRDGFGIKAMIGQILRIDKHENGILTVTRLREAEDQSWT